MSFGLGTATTLAPLEGFAVVAAAEADRGARSLRSQGSLRSHVADRHAR
ncbi:hypothetical protein [Nocardioides dilutus]